MGVAVGVPTDVGVSVGTAVSVGTGVVVATSVRLVGVSVSVGTDVTDSKGVVDASSVGIDGSVGTAVGEGASVTYGVGKSTPGVCARTAGGACQSDVADAAYAASSAVVIKATRTTRRMPAARDVDRIRLRAGLGVGCCIKRTPLDAWHRITHCTSVRCRRSAWPGTRSDQRRH